MAFNLDTLTGNINTVSSDASEYLCSFEYIKNVVDKNINTEFHMLCDHYEHLLFDKSIHVFCEPEDELLRYRFDYYAKLLIGLNKSESEKYYVSFSTLPDELYKCSSFTNELIKLLIDYYGIFSQCYMDNIFKDTYFKLNEYSNLTDISDKSIKLNLQNLVKFIRIRSHRSDARFTANNLILSVFKDSALLNNQKEIFDNFIIPIINLGDEFNLYGFYLELDFSFMKMLFDKFEIDIKQFELKDTSVWNIFSVINVLKEKSAFYKERSLEYNL